MCRKQKSFLTGVLETSSDVQARLITARHRNTMRQLAGTGMARR